MRVAARPVKTVDEVISAPVFAIFALLLEERAGLHYGAADRELLSSKIMVRARDVGFESALDYYYFLRYDAESQQELEALIESVVVHETYFFREVDALEVLITKFVAPRVAAGKRPVLWSAASSTGEEPLSLAMMLHERGLLDKVHVVASDISKAALAKARSGTHGVRAIRTETMPSAARPWLTPTPEGFRMDPRLIDAIEWRQLNLFDDAAVAAMPIADVTLCRNLLFYFRDENARKVVQGIAGRLRDDGALFVGVSESLLRLGTSLVCEEHGSIFVYRKATQ